jgi:hypothetical protein
MTNELVGPWTTASTMKCYNCHTTTNAIGPQGPHGSTIRSILRANYAVGYKSGGTPAAPVSYSATGATDYALCFLCHQAAKVVASGGNGTNFSYHSLHMSKGSLTCRNCHWQPHGTNACTTTSWVIRPTATGAATEYTSAAPPIGFKTRGICFSPDATPNSYSKPAWYLNVSTRARSCYLTCHGKSHAPQSYTPAVTFDNDALTF